MGAEGFMSQTVSVKFSPGPAAAPVNVLLSAVNDPEAAIALAGNRPLPFRDLDLGSIKMQFGPASALKVPVGNQILMVETNGSAHLGLGSYLTLDKALAVVAP